MSQGLCIWVAVGLFALALGLPPSCRAARLTATRLESLSEGPLHAIRGLDPGALDIDNRVRSLHMNPTDDTFISAGDDGTVRVWDLRMPECKVSFMLRVITAIFVAHDASQG